MRCLGVFLFFDRTLLALGNVALLMGVVLLMGVKKARPADRGFLEIRIYQVFGNLGLGSICFEMVASKYDDITSMGPCA